MSQYAELRKGKLRWYYVVRSRNHKVMSVSQKYFSKWNARRAAQRTGLVVHG